MRRELAGYILEYLEEALKQLGYRVRLVEYGLGRKHYRRGRYHVILTPKGNRVALQIHYDPLHCVEKTRYVGKDLEKEFRRIIRTYKMCRAKSL